ncbi:MULTISPECIES: sterol desaturase family protein [unclassified Sphingobacterium]|uniref:sterol desaturase family protein n=1 Tax=unclassified Sphingobacterium TaxID=2609468 RepID=UPI0025FF2E88|nr:MULTISPECIES: sterol desaturase family protein [unclassified Sphingobacterium]
MEELLISISRLNPFVQFLIFLVQNILVFLLGLLFGYYLLRNRAEHTKQISKRDKGIAAGTVLINTVVTLAGFVFWEKGWIEIAFGWSFYAFTDLLILFFAMDLLMYIFHLAIHYSFMYTYIHTLHHESVDPNPIDLFVLHPLETVAFGVMWLLLLLCGTFNIWAISIYLILNVIFGIVGHLGSNNNVPAKGIWSYLGTADFHHAHHRDVKCNFGFYTSIWDRLFRTYAVNKKNS